MSFILPSIGGGIIASPTTPAFSNAYSVDFDGTNDYIDLGTSSTLNPTSALTVSAWVRVDTHNATAGTYDAIYTSSKDGSGANTGFVFTATQNKWYCFYYSGITWYSVVSDSNLVTGQWYHLASTWDGSTAKLYVNGSVQTSTLSLGSITYSTATSAKIGSYYTGNYLDGLIDEVSLFDSALSASDISAMYNSGTPNDISSLNPVGWWRMGDNDGGTGTTVTDQGSGGNDGTLTNGPTFSTSVPTFNTYSVDFDGTNDYMDCSATFTSLWAGSFSISLWLKTPSTFTTGVDNYLGNDFVAGQGYIEFRQRQVTSSSAKIEFYLGNSGVSSSPYGTYGAGTSAVLSTNSWYHLVLTADRPSSGTTTATLYVDGSATTLNLIGGHLSSMPNAGGTWSNNTLIGARNNTSSGSGSGELFLEGHLDEIAFFNSVLSSSDVSTIYNSGVPSDISSFSPVNWWRMGDDDGGTGSTITDQGSSGNDGSLVNSPTFSTTVP